MSGYNLIVSHTSVGTHCEQIADYDGLRRRLAQMLSSCGPDEQAETRCEYWTPGFDLEGYLESHGIWRSQSHGVPFHVQLV